MKATETKIESFLSANKIQFIIPVYQRNYDWTIGQCKQLLDDILEVGYSRLLSAHFIKSGQYSTNTASIEYSDLLEVIKALKTLQSEEPKDVASNPDYLENKFITVDGFEVGYYVDKGKSTWYLKLEKYGNDNNTLFIKDGSSNIETAFNDAKTKIEELKK
jgi:uncharacterized protein with ParB-like and HNH nuclease domain